MEEEVLTTTPTPTPTPDYEALLQQLILENEETAANTTAIIEQLETTNSHLAATNQYLYYMCGIAGVFVVWYVCKLVYRLFKSFF